MLIKKGKYCFLLLAISSLTYLQAQSLNVLEKTGTNTPISINNIKSLTFQSGNLNINLKVGTSVSKALSTVRNLNFAPYTGINLPSNYKNNALQLFPNSTRDFINISYRSDNNVFLDLKIITIDGKIMHSETLNSLNINQFHLNISSWQNGLYLVLINNGFEVITGKFLKTN
jgi:hypothetical protein